MKKKSLCVFLLAMLILSCFSGCGNDDAKFEEPNGDAMVIIAGRHANAKMYTEDVVKEHVLPLVDKCVRYYRDGDRYCAEANIYVIVSDGNPTVTPITYDGQEIELTFSRTNVENLYRDVESLKEIVLQFLMSDDLRADDKEVDLTAAIAEASTALRITQCQDKHLVILDTGVVTDGYMNMDTVRGGIDIQAGTVDQVLDQLSEGAFPNLDGVNVSFVGLGNVGIGQTNLKRDGIFRTRMENLWTAYFARCAPNDLKMNDIAFWISEGEDMVYSEDGDGGYPYVSNVAFQPSQNKPQTEGSSEENVTPPPSEKPIVISMAELNFKGQSWEFVNEEKAQKVIQSYADVISAIGPEETIYVVGSIAKTAPDRNYKTSEISQKRAEAVKALLISECGINPDRIVVIDAASIPLPWRDAVEFPDGTMASRDEAAQAANRVVAIIPASCTDAVQELINAGLLNP